MTGNKKFFINLEEKDLQIHIDMGNDVRYNVNKIGRITFQRESSTPLTLKYVMYVPGLKKNLVSVDMFEDCGYGVIFSEGKVFLHHKATLQVKKIVFRVKNLYKLDAED